MEITVLHVLKPVPVTLLHLQGKLDGTADENLIEEVKREYDAGARCLLLDLTFVTKLNQAGLFTLLKAASIFAEEDLSGADGYHENVKLIHVRPEIQEVFDQHFQDMLFETCTDLHQAVESFK